MSITTHLQQARRSKKGSYEVRTHHMAGKEPRYTNRLILEDSPYLLQHAHNPVNWFAWGDEAFAAAKAEDKPVFLSIGYSTCHWCHVMEEESFDNEATAAILNRHFISIKVDREQRPDLDEIYMTGVQLISGHGGWPMSSFLTPEAKPFYGATYFPPQQFKQLLARINQLWQSNQEELLGNATSVATAINRQLAHRAQALEVGQKQIEQALAQLLANQDSVHGGFGSAPKFPNECNLWLFLDQLEREPDALNNNPKWATLKQALTAMLHGGIYDQLAGGFHRYSTDDCWLVPHFEKMLYNQAQLARLYARSWVLSGGAISGISEFRRISEETLDYVLREMCSDKGAFFSATDADSEGVEGKFFVWSYAELKQLLQPEQLQLAEQVYGVTKQGNFEGDNILYLPQSLQHCADQLQVTLSALLNDLSRLKKTLRQVRSKRVAPLLDDKVITEWNGMMITTLAEAGYLLDKPNYIEAAAKAALFLWSQSRDDEANLYRINRKGKATTAANLEDYSQYLQALITLYDVTSNTDWLTKAKLIYQQMTALFWNEENGGFYCSQLDASGPMIVRAQPYFDGATSSGNSVALTALVALNQRQKNIGIESHIAQLIQRFSGVLSQAPTASCHMLTGIAQHLTVSPTRLQYAAEGSVKVEGKLHTTTEQRHQLSLLLRIRKGWHINSAEPENPQLYPTSVALGTQTQGWEIINVRYQEPQHDEQIDDCTKVGIFLELNAPAKRLPLIIELNFQACNDSACLAPEQIRMIFH